MHTSAELEGRAKLPPFSSPQLILSPGQSRCLKTGYRKRSLAHECLVKLRQAMTVARAVLMTFCEAEHTPCQVVPPCDLFLPASDLILKSH